MRHQCTVCLRAFADDSPPPVSGRVHCVYCGATIVASRRRRQQDREGAVPFSMEAPREEASALGVIGWGQVGFPDTLRQFRVRPMDAPRSDTLMPVAQSGNHDASVAEALGPRGTWRSKSFWLSLSGGLAVGVFVAGVATSSRQNPRVPPRRVLPVAASAVVSNQPAAASAPSLSSVTSASLPAVAPSAKAAAAAIRVYDPSLERRFLLERARSRQREYRLSEAERLYQQVLARAPRDSEALAGLGEVDRLRGTPFSAAEHFQEALRANGDYIPALIAVADLKWEAGRLEEAQRDYERIVSSYAEDLYPPYVAYRSSTPLPAQCAEQ